MGDSSGMDRLDRQEHAGSLTEAYRQPGFGSEEHIATASDKIADILHTIPEHEWGNAIRHALVHATEEIHGWGSAESLHLDIRGF